MIANGRQVAVTIHRLKSLDEDAEDFVIDVQVFEDGNRDLDNVVTTRFSELKKVYDSLRQEDLCDSIKSLLNGVVEIEFSKGETIELTQKEIYEVLVECKRRVRQR